MPTPPTRRGRDFTRPELDSRWRRTLRNRLLVIGSLAVLATAAVALVSVAFHRFA